MSAYDKVSTQLAVLYMMDGLLFTTDKDTGLDEYEQNEVPVEFDEKLISDGVTDEGDMNNELKQIGDIKSDMGQHDPDSVANFDYVKGGKKRRRSKKNRRK